MAHTPLRLGTRGSQLALWQARTVADRIAAAGGPPCEIVTIKTSGDRLQDAPLSEVGGKRLFVKEIEDALLRAEIDLAVHSSKDMPAILPDGLEIAGVLPREDPHDALVLPAHAANTTAPPLRVRDVDELVAILGQTPSLGTSSVRRIAQLSRLFPRGRFLPVRGNLDTRLRKLDEGGYDALVLAAAGLRRLGFSERITLALPAAACIPAPGQGIVAIEIRSGDSVVRNAVEPINDDVAHAALQAERSLVEALGGGCQTPIGALALITGNELELTAAVVALDGSRVVRTTMRGTRDDASTIGRRAAEALLADGAKEILVTVKGPAPGGN